jgi:hypothetical protein
MTCRFFQLVDLLPEPRESVTHPVWLERWLRIRREHFSSREVVDSIGVVDEAFDQLVEQRARVLATIRVL